MTDPMGINVQRTFPVDKNNILLRQKPPSTQWCLFTNTSIPVKPDTNLKLLGLFSKVSQLLYH